MTPIPSVSSGTTITLNCDSGVSDNTRVDNAIFHCLNSDLKQHEVKELKGRVVYGNSGFQLKGRRVLNSGITALPNGKELDKYIAKNMMHVTNYMHHVSTSTLKHPIITLYQDWCLSHPAFSTIHQQARARKVVVSDQLKDFLGKIQPLQELNNKCVPHIENKFIEYKSAKTEQRPLQQDNGANSVVRLASGKVLIFKDESPEQPREELATFMKESFPTNR